MDLDELLTRRRPGWRRLAALVRRARRTPGSLAAEEVDELVEEYLRTTSDLAAVRQQAADPALVSELTSLVATASAVVYGTGVRDRNGLAHAVLEVFPAAAWRIRRAVVVAALLLVLPAVATGAWIVASPEARAALGPPEALQEYVGERFEEYYVEDDNTVFAARVGTNNARVGATAFGLGILAGVPTAAVLAFNGVNVGTAGGLFHAVGEASVFWTSILPHGLLELTAVAVAGGAGLHLGWAVLVPGDRRRGRAVVEEGRHAVVVALGLVPTFGVAALLEGYVTPRTWPAALEITIGALALAGFLALCARGRHVDTVADDAGVRGVRVAGQTRPRAVRSR